MNVILDHFGKPIQRSRNLAGIRRYVGKHLIKKMSIRPIADMEGELLILFENGATYETNFGSYEVLVDFVARWRNVYGANVILTHPNGRRVITTVSSTFAND